MDATTKVVIGKCASGATEPELCDVRASSVNRIVFFTFLLSEDGYNLEHLICFAY